MANAALRVKHHRKSLIQEELENLKKQRLNMSTTDKHLNKVFNKVLTRHKDTFKYQNEKKIEELKIANITKDLKETLLEKGVNFGENYDQLNSVLNIIEKDSKTKNYLENIITLRCRLDYLQKKSDELKEKQLRILKQIQESEDLLKFTLDERKKLITQKKKEIEKKEKLIQQMEETNQNLQSELEILQVQVQGKFNKEEINRKNKQLENERLTRLKPLENQLQVQKQNLKDSLEEINRYKNEIKQLRNKIDKRVDLEELNSLTDEIKMSAIKNEHLEEEIKYLEKVRNEHIKCGIIQKKLKRKYNKKNIKS